MRLPNMHFGDTPALRKARGAFFTPEPIAEFIADWALRDPSDRVLEPSCGEAVFLHAAGRRLRRLNADHDKVQLHGVDLHPESVATAGATLTAAGYGHALSVGDFFDYSAPHGFDAVIGNPPYVRYQDFQGHGRAKALAAALAAGVRLTSLASSWAAFTIHASTCLAVGGRMGLVLPAELLSVNYAAAVRRYLLDCFKDVRLVLFEERVFPNVQEEVVVLLADDYDPLGPGTDHFDVVQVTSIADLRTGLDYSKWTPLRATDKWTAVLGVPNEYTALTASAAFVTVADWGRVALGAVTGNNRFFAVSPERARELHLTTRDTRPLCPPGSTHLRALVFTDHQRRTLGRRGASTLLFSPPSTPSPAGAAYIEAGEALEVNQAYKCSVRSPWWRVPKQEPADLFITYMNADTVALCANPERLRHINSVHGLYLHSQHADIDHDLLALAAVNSVTRLGAEVIGRAYGGGLLKVEPREAALLPMPAPEVVRCSADALRAYFPTARRLLLQGQRDTVQARVDSILAASADYEAGDVVAIREAAHQLHSRRVSRAKEAR